MKNKNMCTLEELKLQAAMLKGKGDLAIANTYVDFQNLQKGESNEQTSE